LRRARRLRRELETVHAMIMLTCRDLHGTKKGLCDECDELWRYARDRVERCPLLPDKPTCRNCETHCFKPSRREQIRAVMRHAGPRMAWHHPVLTVLHLIDGRK
jgi:predicted amidophosphoribosyltransferase